MQFTGKRASNESGMSSGARTLSLSSSSRRKRVLGVVFQPRAAQLLGVRGGVEAGRLLGCPSRRRVGVHLLDDAGVLGRRSRRGDGKRVASAKLFFIVRVRCGC